MGKLAAIALAGAIMFLAARASAQTPAPQASAQGPSTESVPALIERMAKDDFNGLDASRKLTQIGEAAVPALIGATESNVPRVRYWSVAALSGIGSERGIPAVMKLLDDGDPLVRAVAVWHLGRWFDRPEVRDAAMRKLRDESAFVKGWALKLIQEKKWRAAAGQVSALLKDAEPGVRYDALHALAVIEGPGALDTLSKVLRDDESPIVREGAVRCCTVIEPPTARTAEILIAGLEDKDQTVREAAVKLLRKGFGQEPGEPAGKGRAPDIRFEPAAEAIERDKAVKQWRSWYEANKNSLHWNEEKRRFDMADAAPRGRL
jgi:HEAT repeat protein